MNPAKASALAVALTVLLAGCLGGGTPAEGVPRNDVPATASPSTAPGTLEPTASDGGAGGTDGAGPREHTPPDDPGADIMDRFEAAVLDKLAEADSSRPGTGLS